jgi:hypothetical protein
MLTILDRNTALVLTFDGVLSSCRPTWGSRSSISGICSFHIISRSRLCHCQRRTSTKQLCQKYVKAINIEGNGSSTYTVELLEANVLEPQCQQLDLTSVPQKETYPRQPLSRVATSIDGDTSIANRYGHPVAGASGNVLDTHTRSVFWPQSRQHSQGKYVHGRLCLWRDDSSTRWLSGHWERV